MKTALPPTELEREAHTFTRYLLRQVPTDTVVHVYTNALSGRAEPSDKDARIVTFAVEHAWSIAYLDAYLALFRPHAELRDRLYLIFSILEAMPEYVDDFLPQQRSPLYPLKVGLVGARAIVRLGAGTILVMAKGL